MSGSPRRRQASAVPAATSRRLRDLGMPGHRPDSARGRRAPRDRSQVGASRGKVLGLAAGIPANPLFRSSGSWGVGRRRCTLGRPSVRQEPKGAVLRSTRTGDGIGTAGTSLQTCKPMLRRARVRPLMGINSPAVRSGDVRSVPAARRFGFLQSRRLGLQLRAASHRGEREGRESETSGAVTGKARLGGNRWCIPPYAGSAVGLTERVFGSAARRIESRASEPRSSDSPTTMP